MKYIISTIAIIFMFACSQKHHAEITITNTADYDLVEKPFMIQRAQIEEHLGKIGDDEVVLVSADGGMIFIPSQLDDTDGDGQWNELFAMVDLKAGEQINLHLIKKKKVHAPTFKTRTNIHFADKKDPSKLFTSAERLKNFDTQTTQQYFQYEGPGWENDIVGFRNYFDARNGMDIWGKTTTDMILSGVGLAGGPSYHEMQPWGMDVLKVGNSLGAGAIALETPTGLYAIGPEGNGTYHLIAEGPLRSTFDLRFEGIPLEGKMVDINHRICIIAGKPWYKSMVTVKGAEGIKFVTGIVNLETEQVYSNSGSGYAYMFTHDNQAFDGEKLGMAVIIPNNYIEVKTTPEEGEGITQTYYTSLEITDKPNVYFFMVGWEKQDIRWADKDSFEEGVNEQGRLIAAKLDLTFLK